uniref:Uncharacterized protein n=1 Tax=Arundo donax TaxID=35708 RepID=A0A0A9RDB1_ARUDO
MKEWKFKALPLLKSSRAGQRKKFHQALTHIRAAQSVSFNSTAGYCQQSTPCCGSHLWAIRCKFAEMAFPPLLFDHKFCFPRPHPEAEGFLDLILEPHSIIRELIFFEQ